MATWLSDHFTLEELTATQHRKIDNTPPASALLALGATARRMEAVRAALGNHPVTVSSGYRCEKLNRAIGGARKSAHLTGWAVDFQCFRFGTPLQVCRALVAAGIGFDQLIEEGTWIHISFAPAMRGEVLTKLAGGGYARGLPD